MTALDIPKLAPLPANVLEALVQGDIGKLDPAGRVLYYNLLCERLGLDPMTQPFGYLVLSGRLTLYANKACAEQLRKRHAISITITARERIDDCYVVTAHAAMPNGRVDESTGAVSVGNLKGDTLANALMKAETKSKRRVTLSICGLGMIDETEIETIPGARIIAAAKAESNDFTPETIDADPTTQKADAPKTDGAGPAPTDEAEDPERKRVIAHIFALVDEYARVGGIRATELRRKMRDDNERHAFLLDNFGAHGLRQMDPADLQRFIGMIEQRIHECST